MFLLIQPTLSNIVNLFTAVHMNEKMKKIWLNLILFFDFSYSVIFQLE